MPDSSNAKPLDTTTTVNDVIQMYPDSLVVFNELGIDACCGGDASLAEAASRDGVDLQSLLARLDEVATSSGRTS